jgi:hypothetical protein
MNHLMKVKLLAVFLLSLASPLGVAQSVELDVLGAFDLKFQRALPVATYPGEPVAATVTFRKGEAFTVPSPGRVQQIEYLVEPGASVQEGQPFAVIRGPAMHHFEMNYQSSQVLLAGAKLRFDSNKGLYERKAISAAKWLDISEKYYALQLEYEHMRHFFELVVEGDEDPDALTLKAPLTGVIDYSAVYGGVEEGESIALFIPQGAIRMETRLPNRIQGEVVALATAECELPVERVSAMTDGFFVQAWTVPLMSSCDLMLGQHVLATPLLGGAGTYSVPRTAVFQLERQTLVLVREGSTVVQAKVRLLGADGENYLLRSDTDLQQSEVLITSVSAVQGVLLGLGGE